VTENHCIHKSYRPTFWGRVAGPEARSEPPHACREAPLTCWERYRSRSRQARTRPSSWDEGHRTLRNRRP